MDDTIWDAGRPYTWPVLPDGSAPIPIRELEV